MNRKNHKIIKTAVILLGIIIFLENFISISAFAASPKVYSSKTIPEVMQPNTIILYQDKMNYIILEGGFDKGKNQQLKLLNEIIDDEEMFGNETKTNGNIYNVATEEFPSPCKGTKVVYGTDGLINNIENGRDSSVCKTSSKTIESSSKKKKLIAEWGTKKYNKLYRSGSQIIGYGRATTFNDRIGQRDNTLKKGDIATKQKWDNCKYGLRVKVKAHKKDSKNYLTHSMYKRDVGGLPNAIVDIWKTGVEYWGYQYSGSLTLSGKTKIVHDDK